MTTYEDVRRAIDDARAVRNQGQPPSSYLPNWFQLILAVGAMIVTLTLAYSALDKRITILEQKLDYISYQINQNHR